MGDAAWWQWALLVVWAVVPIPSLLLGLGGINVVMVAVLLILWLASPSVGCWVYVATWVNLVGYRLLLGRQLQATPMTMSNQNGASAWLAALGIVGAIRSGFAGDAVATALGVVGVVLFMVQGPLFSSAAS
jgi:hypothetical protein